MSNIYTSTYNSPVGEIVLGVFEDQLCLCDWKYRKERATIDNRIKAFLAADFVPGNHDLFDQTSYQLDQYFEGNLQDFHLPLLLCGTDFQQSVWKSLLQIPYGQTMSYGSLSRKRNDPKSIRAVAGANGANAISIIVPCHRIIGADGSLTGYAGGLPAKKALLKIEGVDLTNGQQSLF